jgi:SAM-dependent methyltransferase
MEYKGDQMSDNSNKKNNGQYFWFTKEAREGYKGVAEDLPLSNYPAVESVYALLKPRKKIILDYGCFQGYSSKRILDRGAKAVYGVDINPEIVKIARKIYDNEPNLHFYDIDTFAQIPLPENYPGYDGAAVTFVHPVIPKVEYLENMFKGIYKVLLPGASAIFLGLHPNSFYTDEKFFNYEHRLPKSGIYKDGEPFPNLLKKNDGTKLSFFDYCWTQDTLIALMEKAGFKKIEVISLTQNIKGYAGDRLRKAIKKIKDENGIDFENSPEFTIPLYQVFVATK